MNGQIRVVACGDAAVLVEFDERIDPAINADVLALAERFRAEALSGVLDIVPAFRSLGVYFDPVRLAQDHLMGRLRALTTTPLSAQVRHPAPKRVPVCYGEEWGPDLAGVAAFSGLSEAGVVQLHVGATYRVFMLGFAPGFAYMGTVNPTIAMPRRTTPRAKVSTGSVAIAGGQTGIYSIDTPGGWNVIGRTPLRPFDFSRSEPFFFKAGDLVSFYPISREEFDTSSAGGANR